jgi:hypothetical protein
MIKINIYVENAKGQASASTVNKNASARNVVVLPSVNMANTSPFVKIVMGGEFVSTVKTNDHAKSVMAVRYAIMVRLNTLAKSVMA